MLILFCLLFSCSNEPKDVKEKVVVQKQKPKTEEELRQELVEKELKNPKKYLKIFVERKDPFIGRAYLICSVRNTATMATFKDIVIQVQYWSKTNSMIKKWDNTFYEFITPYSSKDCRIDLLKYGDEVASIKTVIVGAAPVK
ncbi:MAG: hypothetical protein A2475_01165 [Ignavibacteria bacterium RIFOXYC2_FULL_35_21]|nr:MAG: hypothetical protein A2220_01880 [Ignavibacteria bacterium RIFOXYA2_FULL_35_10]OGV21255.1 MAG: hypothetical protein A2475_01165 [Ignavibacteria bacterium RIFOXYC2_FULL_35_21]